MGHPPLNDAPSYVVLASDRWRRQLLVLWRHPSASQFPIPAATVFDRALLGLKVDVDDAKALGITVRPFEVVEQRPYEVALNGHSLALGLKDGGNMRLE